MNSIGQISLFIQIYLPLTMKMTSIVSFQKKYSYFLLVGILGIVSLAGNELVIEDYVHVFALILNHKICENSDTVKCLEFFVYQIIGFITKNGAELMSSQNVR